MKIKYRNTSNKIFKGKASIQNLINFILMAEEAGWLLDISTTNSGLSITSEGITVHFVKYSEDVEEMDQEGIFMSAVFMSYKEDTRKVRI